MKNLSKKVFGLICALMLMVSNLNATILIKKDAFDDCVEEAVIDYSITGDMGSAIDVYNDCVDATLEELENMFP